MVVKYLRVFALLVIAIAATSESGLKGFNDPKQGLSASVYGTTIQSTSSSNTTISTANGDSNTQTTLPPSEAIRNKKEGNGELDLLPPESSSSTESTPESTSFSKPVTVPKTQKKTTTKTTTTTKPTTIATPPAVVLDAKSTGHGQAADAADREKEKKNLFGLLYLLYLPIEVRSWTMCYSTSDTYKRCPGICVVQFNRKADWTSETQHYCQEYDNYSPENTHLCTDTTVPYPNTKIFYSNLTQTISYKYCCKTSYCNSNTSLALIVPQQLHHKENSELEDYGNFQMAVMMVTVLILLAQPFYYYRDDKQEAQRLTDILNEPLQEAVMAVSLKCQPTVTVINVSQPVSGQLVFKDLVRVLAQMELWQPKIPKRISMGEIKYTEYRYDCTKSEHGLSKTSRDIVVSYEKLLWNLLEHGPYMYDWKPFDLVELFDQAQNLFDSDGLLLTLQLPILIIGDIRGQYVDLHRWLQLAGHPPHRQVLFLGGVVDPDEPGSLDCLAFICAMKVAYPKRVFMLRGAPEAMPLHFGPRFGVLSDPAILSAATRLCSYLPLAALISKKILCVHSGITHQLANPKCFELVDRPFHHDSLPYLARQLIFNQPTTAIKKYRNDPETDTDFFGLHAITQLSKIMGLSMIVRSRNPLPDGILWTGSGGNMVSLWSAPGKESFQASVMHINCSMHVKIFTLKAHRKNSSETAKTPIGAASNSPLALLKSLNNRLSSKEWVDKHK